MFFTLTKDFRFFTDGYSLMLTGQFGAMIVHITLRTEIGFFCDTIELSKFRWHLGAILAIRRLCDKFLMGIDSEIYQIHG